VKAGKNHLVRKTSSSLSDKNQQKIEKSKQRRRDREGQKTDDIPILLQIIRETSPQQKKRERMELMLYWMASGRKRKSREGRGGALTRRQDQLGTEGKPEEST